MGKKGDKLTNASVLSAEILFTKLESIGGITTKKMFGGHGIFHDKKMFGMVTSKGLCCFKANAMTKADYEEKGGVKHGRMPYFSIPNEVMDDFDLLLEWAKKAIEISK